MRSMRRMTHARARGGRSGTPARRFRIVAPPAKDIREWVCRGATREMFDALADSAQRRLG
jgi:hypothetical protein